MDQPFERTRRVKGPCLVEGCGDTEKSRGMCGSHYYRDRKYGDPHAGQPPQPKFDTVEERFWSKVDKRGDGCWMWEGQIFPDGYGAFQYKRNGGRYSHRAHRYAYMISSGDMNPPRSMDVDHMCHTPGCVNPAHLRLVTRKQNAENRRGVQSNSESGIRGVKLEKKTGRWQGRVRHNGKDINVGMFDTPEQAEAAVIAKRNELFTHNDLDRVSNG